MTKSPGYGRWCLWDIDGHYRTMGVWIPEKRLSCGEPVNEMAMPLADHMVIECPASADLPDVTRQLIGYAYLDPDRRDGGPAPGTLDER